jgi:hypothetical protein
VADPEDKVGTVTIKAVVSDAWGWAVLAVLVGTLAALALLRYSGLARSSFNLNLRRWEALDAIDKATAKVAAATGKPWAGANVAQAATDKSTEISTKINELGQLSFSEADAKKVAEIEAALAALTTAAANLDALAGVMPKLELARDSLSRRASPLPQTVPAHSGAPPLGGSGEEFARAYGAEPRRPQRPYVYEGPGHAEADRRLAEPRRGCRRLRARAGGDRPSQPA